MYRYRDPDGDPEMWAALDDARTEALARGDRREVARLDRLKAQRYRSFDRVEVWKMRRDGTGVLIGRVRLP